MELLARIDGLLEADDLEAAERIAELEDTLHEGIAAIHAAELRVRQIHRELESAPDGPPDRLVELTRELRQLHRELARMRPPVTRLAVRTRELRPVRS